MLKKILISLGVVIVATGLMIGILFAIKQAQPQPEPDQSSQDEVKVTDTVADLSKDYGACNLLDLSFIKTTLGEVASDLQQPENMGIVGDVNIGPGLENVKSDSQICAYPFVAGGEIENGFNNGNSFTVQVTKYATVEGAEAVANQTQESGVAEPVDNLGDSAFYSYTEDAEGISDATYTFVMQVFKDSQLTTLTLRQPAEESAFDNDTAKDVLIKLAEQANQ